MDKSDLENIIFIGKSIAKRRNVELDKVSVKDAIDEYDKQIEEYWESANADYWAEQYADEQWAASQVVY